MYYSKDPNRSDASALRLAAALAEPLTSVHGGVWELHIMGATCSAPLNLPDLAAVPGLIKAVAETGAEMLVRAVVLMAACSAKEDAQ